MTRERATLDRMARGASLRRFHLKAHHSEGRREGVSYAVITRNSVSGRRVAGVRPGDTNACSRWKAQ